MTLSESRLYLEIGFIEIYLTTAKKKNNCMLINNYWTIWDNHLISNKREWNNYFIKKGPQIKKPEIN